MERVVNGDASARRLVDSSHVKLKDVAVIIVVLCVASTSNKLAAESQKRNTLTYSLQIHISVNHFMQKCLNQILSRSKCQ